MKPDDVRDLGRNRRVTWPAVVVGALLGMGAVQGIGCSDADEGSTPSWGADAGQDGSEADASLSDAPQQDGPLGDAAHQDAEPEVGPPDVQVSDGEADGGALDAAAEVEGGDGEGGSSPCPEDMVLVEGTCVDRYEAPNREGALPLVMFHFLEAESWCLARGKRLCFDDEWTRACEGEEGWPWVYGSEHEPGLCNDEETWMTYDQTLLNGWPWSLDTDAAESLEELLEAARTVSVVAAAAADHVEALYQGEPSGQNAQCVNAQGVYDLNGNVEEWTSRRDGGEPSFHGNLKGRYWAEPRTCQQGVTTHGDMFRFYEIGFRCCRDAQ